MPDNVPPVRFVAKNMRLDLRLIAEMIPEDARVLDIGCGDGALLDHLTREKGADARGIEIDMAEVARAVYHMASMPEGTNIQWLTVMATNMPYIGRG